MKPLKNPIRPYPWGSRTAIATMQDRPAPTAIPEAELWLGAHPNGPSTVPGGALSSIIAADPETTIGPAAMARFGPRLPYLFKVLAAAEPLSIQVHPDAEQAAAGFAAENEAGLPGPRRTYVDPYPKPEIIVALDDFDALCGFRQPAESAEVLRGLGVPGLDPIVAALRTGSTEDRLRTAVSLLLGWPESARTDLVSSIASSPAAADLAVDLAKRYPSDVGVVLALLLNRVHLRRDEAIFMPPGNPHAYLRGVGVELMAASDNVARAGLTPKHVAPREVCRLLRFQVLDAPVVSPVTIAPGLVTWPAPIAEFALHQAAPAGSAVTLPGGGPRIVLCVAGRASLRAGDETVEVRGGRAMFVAAAEPPVSVSGDCVVFQASCPV